MLLQMKQLLKHVKFGQNVSRFFLAVCFAFILLSYQNCGPMATSNGGSTTDTASVSTNAAIEAQRLLSSQPALLSGPGVEVDASGNAISAAIPTYTFRVGYFRSADSGFQKPPDSTFAATFRGAADKPDLQLNVRAIMSGPVAVQKVFNNDASRDPSNPMTILNNIGPGTNLSGNIRQQVTDVAECPASGTIKVIYWVEDSATGCSGPCKSPTRRAYNLNVVNACPLEKKIVATDANTGDQLGSSVSIDGNLMATSAPGWTPGTGASESRGAIYVNQFEGGIWKRKATLVPSDAAANDILSSVAVRGDKIVGGAPGKNGSQGRVYVWQWNGTSATQIANVAPVGGNANDGSGFYGDEFGRAVSTDGINLAIGAPGDGVRKGAVYICPLATCSSANLQKINGLDNTDFDYLGFSVSLAGDHLMAGAPRSTSKASTGRGFAVYFKFNGSSFVQMKRFEDANLGMASRGGYAVAVLPGATSHRVFWSAPESGNGYVQRCVGADSTWSCAAITPVSNGTLSGSKWGTSLSVNSGFLAIGAPAWSTFQGLVDIMTVDGAHKYRLYARGAQSLAEDPAGGEAATSGRANNNRYGSSVAVQGNRLVVGSYNADMAVTDSGAAYIYEIAGY